MMRRVWAFFFVLFISGISLAQENTVELMKVAEEMIHFNPEESIRIAEFVSKKSHDKKELIKAKYILARSYYITGNYALALQAGFRFSQDEIQDEEDTQLKIYALLTRILRELELNQLAREYMTKALAASQKTKNTNTLKWFKAKTIQYGLGNNPEDYSNLTLERLDSAKTVFKKIPSTEHYFQIGLIDLKLASLFMEQSKLDTVPYFLQNAYSESQKIKPGNFLEMKYLLEYGNYLFLKRDHITAIDSLRAAQRIAEKFTNIAAQFAISEAIAENYIALGQIENFNIQNRKTQLRKVAKDEMENDAVNTAFNFINDSGIAQLQKAQFFYSRNFYIFSGVCLLVLLLWGGMALRYRIKIKQYQSFIDFFDKKQRSETNLPPKDKVEKQTVVPKEMEETILEKLSNFETSTDFTNPDTSLSRMALQFETNTKYLSEVVNTHKRKNFNAYINELRINYIIDKLKNDPTYLQYKISYLAEESGFSSHSVFATVFKQVTGVPPTRFITILKDKKEVSQQKERLHAS